MTKWTLIILALLLQFSCERRDNSKNQTIVEYTKIDTIYEGKGIEQVLLGGQTKSTFKLLGIPTEIFSRTESKQDSIFFPIPDTTASFEFYFDFDTVYHFRNSNKYGVSEIYSKQGTIKLLSFSYLSQDYSKIVMVNGTIIFLDTRDKILKNMKGIPFTYTPKDNPLLKDFGVKEDKFENLYYFDRGICFQLHNDELVSYTLFNPKEKDFTNFLKMMKYK